MAEPDPDVYRLASEWHCGEGQWHGKIPIRGAMMGNGEAGQRKDLQWQGMALWRGGKVTKGEVRQAQWQGNG